MGKHGIGDYFWTGALLALVTGVGVLVRDELAAPDLAMLYLLVIGMAAALFGRVPSVLASVISMLAYDFFFVTPYYTFAVHDQRHLITFAMMFVVGVLISDMTLRIRRQAVEARVRDAATAALALRARTEEMRSSLLSAVSHDLRTPLAAITGAATTLREQMGVMDLRERTELLDTVCEEAERLERLVRNLLDMTQLESGMLQVKREWVPLEEIVGSALNRLEDALADRTIRTELPADLPLLSVDPVLLEQVFVNLLENARKYTPLASPLDIAAHVHNGATVIEVADRGSGLAQGSELRIFEKFVRGKGIAAVGAGLGLAICRGVVEAHGGTIVAENREGGGAVFRMILPRVGVPPVVPQDSETDLAHGDRPS